MFTHIQIYFIRNILAGKLELYIYNIYHKITNLDPGVDRIWDDFNWVGWKKRHQYNNIKKYQLPPCCGHHASLYLWTPPRGAAPSAAFASGSTNGLVDGSWWDKNEDGLLRGNNGEVSSSRRYGFFTVHTICGSFVGNLFVFGNFPRKKMDAFCSSHLMTGFGYQGSTFSLFVTGWELRENSPKHWRHSTTTTTRRAGAPRNCFLGSFGVFFLAANFC